MATIDLDTGVMAPITEFDSGEPWVTDNRYQDLASGYTYREIWKSETAWAATAPGVGRFTAQGNWATWFYYEVKCAVYELNISAVNGNTGYTHEFTLTYCTQTGAATGTGTYTGTGGPWDQEVSDVTFDFTGAVPYVSFKAVYPNNYTWYPAFWLEANGILTFVNLAGDNVNSATGTWSISY